MAKANTKRNAKLDVTIKPWWQTQIVAALVGAAIGLVPFVYEKIQENDEKRDSIGLSFLVHGFPGPFSWTNANKNSYSVRLIGTSFGASDSWIMLNTGAKKIKLGRGIHNGQFAVVVDNLACDTTYYYRVEALREGRIAAGPIANLSLPKCSTPAEIASAEIDPHFTPNRSILSDPNLPLSHPLPGGFGDEIRHSPTGPNRGNIEAQQQSQVQN
jgi:hypothetical protein